MEGYGKGKNGDLSKAMAYNGMMPMASHYADDMTRSDIYKAFTALLYGEGFDPADPKSMGMLYAARGYMDGMIDAFESAGYGEKGYGTKRKGMYNADTSPAKAHGHCATCTCGGHATIDDIIGGPRMRYQSSHPAKGKNQGMSRGN